MTDVEPPTLGPLGPASWTRTPPAWHALTADTLAWTSSPRSDFWRETGGVPSAHDGNALLAPVAGDFDYQVSVTGLAASTYDQFGVFLLRDERHWVKSGIELDGTLWLSTVVTAETSDWSREPAASPAVTLRVTRTAGALRLFVRDDGWRMTRELTFAGPASFGVYSCAPKGPGVCTVARVEPGHGD